MTDREYVIDEGYLNEIKIEGCDAPVVWFPKENNQVRYE